MWKETNLQIFGISSFEKSPNDHNSVYKHELGWLTEVDLKEKLKYLQFSLCSYIEDFKLIRSLECGPVNCVHVIYTSQSQTEHCFQCIHIFFIG